VSGFSINCRAGRTLWTVLRDSPVEEVAFVDSLAPKLGSPALDVIAVTVDGSWRRHVIGRYLGQERLRDRLRTVLE
jgi:hypothetical protein